MRTADAARAAFAIGFAEATALHPVPVTDRARATLASAIALAETDQAHAEHVVEATLILGQLEGVWAAIYDRREKVLTDGIAEALARWQDLEPDFGPLVDVVRRNNNLPTEETIAPPDPSVTATLAGLFKALASDAELAKIVAKWIRHSEAEGKVGALALAADEAGAIGFDFDVAFTDAIAALGDMESTYWNARAAEYIEQALLGTASDLGGRLAKLVEEQATHAQMLAGVRDLFSTGKAVKYSVDMALSAGLSQGALRLYISEGVDEIYFVTAGDERVCMECDSAETGSPYSPTDPSKPEAPIHGFCRCCWQASDVGSAAWQQYVTDNIDLN